jgi:hypothetical protein
LALAIFGKESHIFPWAGLHHYPLVSTFCIAGMTGTCHHTQLLWLRCVCGGVSLTFCQHWPQTLILLISASWVVRLTSRSHCTQQGLKLLFGADFASHISWNYRCEPPHLDCSGCLHPPFKMDIKLKKNRIGFAFTVRPRSPMTLRDRQQGLGVKSLDSRAWIWTHSLFSFWRYDLNLSVPQLLFLQKGHKIGLLESLNRLIYRHA